MTADKTTAGQPAGQRRPADRYGDRPSPGPAIVRRRLIAVLIGFVVLGGGFAAWAGQRQAGAGVTSSDLGFQQLDPGTAEVTWRAQPPAGRSAVCTIRVVDGDLNEVGRVDVEVPAAGSTGPTGSTGSTAAPGQIQVTRLRTSEPGSNGGVKACRVR